MGFQDAIITVFMRYAEFGGRSRRSEYWYFVLFNWCLTAVLGLLGQKIGLFSFLSGVYGLAALVPGIAVAVRRMHDIGKSGWYLLISFIPVVGTIIVIYWLAKDSEPGTNIYGQNPKGIY